MTTSNGVDELEQNKKLAEQKLSGKELYEFQKKQKEESWKKEMRKAALSETPKKIGRYLLYGGIAFAIIGGLALFLSTRLNLPPISLQNHVEQSPPAHILDQPIPEAIQRHMLEHADGRGAPGIIIQYNCRDFECESDLVEKLKALVKEYPDNVYLAPNNYDGKIILTKLGKLKILESFDERAIRDFIE